MMVKKYSIEINGRRNELKYEQWKSEVARLLKPYALMKYTNYIGESSMKEFYEEYDYLPREAAKIIYLNNINNE